MKVSIITPTIRPDRLKNLERMIERQDYQDIEHIVIEGFTSTIGEKRNIACAKANGEVICMMDDDDHFTPTYVSKSLGYLFHSGADVTGLSGAYFLHDSHQEAWKYQYTGGAPYVIGSGMMFYKRVWEKNRFKHISSGEDTEFLRSAGRISPHPFIDSFVAMIHANNTSSHQAVHKMIPISPEIPLNILSKM